MAQVKPTMNVVFVGHVDHGKSTCVGRLMYDSGVIPEQEMKKLKEEAVKHGKVGFEFAFVMDKIKEERERGVTIDLSYQKLITPKRQITIIDAPGHKDFVKNMITGASQADAAFLTISAKDGVQPQTIESIKHIQSAKIPSIVALNKIDKPEANVQRVKQELAENSVFVEGYGGSVSCVEVSAKEGTGVDALLDMILLTADVENIIGDVVIDTGIIG